MTDEPRFRQWLEPSRWDDDETVSIGLLSQPADEWLEVPTWVYGRVSNVAFGYLPRIKHLALTCARSKDDQLTFVFP